jgi:phosphoglycerate dehydrogenase-like enzyme
VKIVVPVYSHEHHETLKRLKCELAFAADERAAIEQVEDADAAVGFCGAPVVEAGKKLRWLQTESAGVDAVLPHVPKHIVLTSARGAYAPQLAEHHLAMMMSLARRLGTHRRDGVFRTLEGSTLHVVGEGATGQALLKKAKALGMKKGALKQADFIAICAPLTEKTRGLFNAKLLKQLKPGAILTNAARGAIVETPALVEALKSGHLAGAGLDVTDPEPLSADNPLWQMDNVILTPHIGGYAPHVEAQVFAIVLENIRRFLSGRPLLNIVDRKKGY